MSTSDLPPSASPAVSKNEHLKANSRNLRGTLAQELTEPTPRFSGDAAALLKFHGSYQQEDRDQRRARRETGDEKAYQFMVRSKIPGGRLTAAQYLVHDELASRYANGTLRITTRQTFQLHGIAKSDLRSTIKTINEALLTTLGTCGDIVRNVVTCPAPDCEREALGLQEFARQICQHTLPRGRAYHEIWIEGTQVEPAEPEEEPLYGKAYLPRKFKLGIAAPGDNCIDLYTHDLGYVPHVESGRVTGFTLLAGGGMGMTHRKPETYPRLADAIAFVPAELLIESVEAVVGIHRDFGDRTNRRHARLKYVVAEMGVEAFRSELERRMGRKLEDPKPLTWENASDHLGWHEQGDGRWYLGIPVENGRIADSEKVRLRSGLRAIVSELQCEVRLTPQQNLLLCGIEAADRERVEGWLREYGIARSEELAPVLRNALACPALPTCGLAITEAERALPSVSRELAAALQELGLGDETITVRMTGCPNGCARPYAAEIGFVGKSVGTYDLYLGADFFGTRLGLPVAEAVPRDRLVAALRPVLAAFAWGRHPGERFGDFCARLGAEALRRLVAGPVTPPRRTPAPAPKAAETRTPVDISR